MTAEQLEELLGKVSQGDWRKASDGVHIIAHNPFVCSAALSKNIKADTRLIALAPSLARRVLAAEKLVEALEELPLGDGPLAQLVTAYREASK
jgi:hypothetical protein